MASLTLTATAEPAPADIMTAAALAAFPQPEADFVIAYGDDPLQFGELRLPDGDGPFPVVVFIHGGCWMSEYDIAHSRKLADALPRAGIATWSLEYRRIGDPGGAWPGTFEDVEAGYAHLAALVDEHPLDPERVIVAGHSAGGHLALWIAQAEDLEYLYEHGTCDGAVAKLMGGSPGEYPDRYAAASVTRRIPQTIPQIAVIGKFDETWRPVGVRYATAGLQQGAPIEIIDAPESGHFEMIDPDSTTWPLVLDAARRLLDIAVD